MTDFRTIIKTNPSDTQLGLQQNVLTIGSCFAEVIGTQLKKYKINTLANPFGTVYNPYSIHKLLHYAIQNQADLMEGNIQNQDVYLNYDFHSEFSSLSQTDLQTTIAVAISSTHNFLKKADWIIVTYGTAWVYTRNDTREIVSNCHKMPASQFTKSLLTQDQVVQSFENLYTALKKINQNIKILLTVSPVRHTKDTLELNSVSKAVLRLACHNLTSAYPDVNYFPAYEIMMDDLRDYRFYKSDMLHPSQPAEDYIWEKFVDRYADSDLKNFLQEWQEIYAALTHRPFHASSLSHQKFLVELLKRLERLKDVVNVDLEKKAITDQLMQ